MQFLSPGFLSSVAAALLTAAFKATGGTIARTSASRAADALSLLDFSNSDGTPVDLTGAKDIGYALNAALALGDVRLPSGILWLNSTVAVPDGRRIYGPVWSEAGSGSAGAWIKITSTSFNPFTATGRFVLRDVAFTQTQPTPGSTFMPTAYPYIITAQGGSIDADGIYFFGCTNGINLTESSGGTGSARHRLKRISGETFGPMIHCDVVTDTMHIDDVHHWPFWTIHNNLNSTFTQAQAFAVYNYKTANTDVILTRRNDDPFISNVFAYGARSTIRFDKNSTSTNNSGATSLAMVTNIGADATRYGLLITAGATTITATGVECQGYDPSSPNGNSPVVMSNSATVMLDDSSLDGAGTGISGCIIGLTDCESSHTDYGLVQNFGTGNIFRLVNPKMTAWDALARGTYAIKSGGSANTCMVVNPLYLSAPAANNRIDLGATVTPTGALGVPGLQIGDLSGTGLSSVSGSLVLNVSGNTAASFNGFDPAASLLLGGSSTNLYLSATGANVGWVITPNGSGIINLNGNASAAISMTSPVFYENGTSLASKYALQSSLAKNVNDYILIGFQSGTGAANLRVFAHGIVHPITLPAALSGSLIYAFTGATNSTAYTLSYLRGSTLTVIATLTFAAGGQAGAQTPTISNVTIPTLQANDILVLVGPAAVDPTLADITFTFMASKT